MVRSPNAVRPLAACVLTAAAVAACARVPSGVASPFNADLTVTVNNASITDTRIFFVRGSTLVYIGSVGSMERRTFTLASGELDATGTIQFLAQGLGSAVTQTSTPLQVVLGQRIEWELRNNPRLATIRVVH